MFTQRGWSLAFLGSYFFLFRFYSLARDGKSDACLDSEVVYIPNRAHFDPSLTVTSAHSWPLVAPNITTACTKKSKRKCSRRAIA
uniref:Putative secreted protein n=1 Tax=Ixodes ricinus TaxID=34613 RepID=A0A6B0U426_IXORI